MRLGPFDLQAPAGRGAMAEVWHAVHHTQGVPVAIKVVTAPVGQRQKFRSWFAHELRAVAMLDHPGVVRIYDHGDIPDAVAAASHGRLPAGAPYLAMEWIPDGAITAHAGRLPWPSLRWALLGLLDALGHAHARGVIHRDLKPDNILFAERGPVLTDFGVAFTAERAADEREEAFAGTPNYMSPEQVTGDLRMLGPWSDLYAFGCLAHTLVCGRAPFDGPDAGQVARAQLLTPPPQLADGMPVPRGFRRWLSRLLSKRPADRFQFAADAAVALMALSDEAPLPPVRHTSSLPHIDPSAADATIVAPPVFLSAPAEIWAAGPDLLGRPPCPPVWQRPMPPPIPPPLLGVGRTIFGLRPPTPHGRVAERDAMWRALRSVAEGGGARAMLIEGPAGRGKSRLAWWLAHRAHELGVADVMAAHHDASDGPSSGLGPMLARFARAEGLEYDARRRLLDRALGSGADANLVDALSALIAPDASWMDDRAGVSLGTAAERNALLAQALALATRRRPIVVCLEDLHWAADTLGFVDAILTGHRDLPVLFVGTVREDGLTEGSVERALLDRLSNQARVERLPIRPLDSTALADAIRGRLPLAPALARQVAERAEGNPVFAEAVVERWIHVGALENATDGFQLRASHAGSVPEALHGLLDERLDDAVSPCDRLSLELAAVLGHTVDNREWRAACALGGIAPLDDDRFGALLDDGLVAEGSEHHWSFVHPLLREALLSAARQSDRLARWHSVCATLMASRHAPPARQARHLVAAGELDDALEPLRAAADQALSRKQAATAQRALVSRSRALRGLGRRLTDPAWIENQILWAQMCRTDGRTRAAARHARHATVGAERIGDARLLARALIERGRAVAVTDGIGRGLPLVVTAAHRAASVDDDSLEARARLIEGGMRLASGDASRARGAYERALDLLRDRDEIMMEANVFAALADVARREGEHDKARTLATRAGEIYTRGGNRWGRAHAANLLGDITRFQGELDTAEAHYRESRRLYGGVGSFDALAAEGNLALVLMETARFAEARTLLEGAIRRADHVQSKLLSQVFRACLLPCLATAGDWTAWDDAIAVIAAVRGGKLLEPDVARTARRAARIAASAGEPRRAAQAWKMVVVQLEGLGQDATEGREALARLSAGQGR